MKVLITGGTSGIGFEVAKRLAHKNHDVLIATHTINQQRNLLKKIENEPKIKALKLDIKNSSDRKKIEDMKIDILFNNAGIGEGGSIAEIDMNKVRDNFETNVFSSFELVQLILKGMIKRKKGRIVIMSSLLGIIPMEFLGVYSATKSSIISLSIALKKELKLISKDIKVCLIEPGAYHTGFNQVMLDNKYTWMKEKSYFKRKISDIRKKENMIFKIIEKKRLNSIVKKIEKACVSESPRFIYRAPFLQVLGAKIYQLIFE